MAAFNDVASICQEAFYIIRQDASVLTEQNWGSQSAPVEVAKCRLAVETAVNEVADAFKWKSAVTAANVASWPRKVRNACVYCLARELAIPIAGRIEDMKAMDALYRDKLMQARLTDLNNCLADLTANDSILAQLVANFHTDDTGLVTAYEVYTKRIAAVRSECEEEVKQALGITALDAMSTTLVGVLCVSKLAVPCGMTADAVQLKVQEYQAGLAQYRKVRLDKALETNTDPVLAELLSNFRLDDAGLTNAFAVYTKRATVVKETATAEINVIHDWQAAFSSGDKGHVAYPAWVALCCAKLAAACGLDANNVQMFEQKYQSRIQVARSADLEDAKEKISDPDVREVMSLITSNFVAGDGTMPRSIRKITSRIEQIKESARREVLLSQDWNFAKTVESIHSYGACSCYCKSDAPYVYHVEYPKRMLRLIAVETYQHALTQWKIEDGLIKAKAPIVRIRYTRDVSDLSKWSAFAKNAYIHRLAASVARTVMNSPADAQAQEQLYMMAIENAKLRDTRESNTEEDAWGENHHVKAMQGRRLPYPQDRPEYHWR